VEEEQEEEEKKKKLTALILFSQSRKDITLNNIFLQ
jgi:hypothetical protein